MEFIEKKARKKSNDPIQEALRSHKERWNKDASLLIAQLIAFKKGLNGRGDPRVGLPPSNIKNEFPGEVGLYLDQLVDRFNVLATDAISIIEEQNNYSNNRVKGRKEAMLLIQNDMPKFGSWWGSRLWSYLRNQYLNPKYWIFTNEDVKDRMDMLKSIQDIIDKLHDMENNLVSHNNEAIAQTVYDFLEYATLFSQNLMDFMNVIIERHSKNVLKSKPDESQDSKKENIVLELSGDNSKYEDKDDQKIDKIQEDNNNFGFRAITMLHALNKIDDNTKKYLLNKQKEVASSALKLRSPISVDNDLLEKKLYLAYNEMLGIMSDTLKSKFNTFENILEYIQTNIKKADCDINKLAHNIITRWLKRKLLGIAPDNVDRLRIKGAIIVSNIVEKLDDLQNALESNDTSIVTLSDLIINIADLSASLSEILFLLAKVYNFQSEKFKLKNKSNLKQISETNLSRLNKTKQEFESIKLMS